MTDTNGHRRTDGSVVKWLVAVFGVLALSIAMQMWRATIATELAVTSHTAVLTELGTWRDRQEARDRSLDVTLARILDRLDRLEQAQRP